MNKRGNGETSSQGGAIIAAIIAALVLVIAAIGVSMYLKSSETQFSLLPEFSDKKESPNGDVLVKFEIPTQKIYYYNNVKWVELKPGKFIEIDNYKITYDNLNNSFFNYYYPYGRAFGYEKVFLEKGEKVFGFDVFDIYRFENGSIALPIFSEGAYNPKLGPYYLISLSNKFFRCDPDRSFISYLFRSLIGLPQIECKEIFSLSGDLEKARRAVINYRDKPLIEGRPITIRFSKTEKTISQDFSFCVEKKYDKDLVVNLRKPLSEGEICPKLEE